MKAFICIIVIILFGLNATYAQNESSEIPSGSKALLDQLADWELKQKMQLEKEIRAKRDQVVGMLKKHLETTTKSGNLVRALAIKDKINKLSSAQELALSIGSANLAAPGQVWAGAHPDLKGNWTLELFADGKAKMIHGKSKQQRRWVFENPNILYCWHPNQTKTTGWKLTVDSSGKTAKLETTKGGGRGKAVLKRAN